MHKANMMWVNPLTYGSGSFSPSHLRPYQLLPTPTPASTFLDAQAQDWGTVSKIVIFLEYLTWL